MWSYDALKRVLDVVVGGVAFVALLPVQGVIGYLVKQKLGPPVLFRQQRPGKDGEVFELVKFRTMLEVDESQGLVSDEQRLTSFGAFLRSTSLDELPSLWNVVRGDMSLVGPRPLLVRYLERYTPQQARRHEVRPGVTGLAQVSGRNALTWEEKFDRDIEYVKNRSFQLDLKIMLLTVVRVGNRDGISANDDVTMPEYMGGPDG